MTEDADRLYERLLVLRCKAGDGSGFEELIECYQPRLRYYLRQLVSQPTVVDDLLQDVWLDVFRGISGLVEVAAFRTWIYRIARVRALGMLRRRKPEQSLSEDDEPIDEAQFEANLSAESAEQIHAALHELGDEHREVLVLCFLEDMSYDDIANVTGCPIGTVRSRIHYAKRALRRLLERMNCYE